HRPTPGPGGPLHAGAGGVGSRSRSWTGTSSCESFPLSVREDGSGSGACVQRPVGNMRSESKVPQKSLHRPVGIQGRTIRPFAGPASDSRIQQLVPLLSPQFLVLPSVTPGTG